MPTERPTQPRDQTEALMRCAMAFARKHNLEPLEVLRDFLDLAIIRRGLGKQSRQRTRWN